MFKVSDIKGPPADLTFTLTVTRKDTGIKETFQMEGFLINEIIEVQPVQPQEGEAQCPQP